ncbi:MULTISPECIES: hypothetical protein [Kitasatospora]|uniref:Secreted protein n=1 Tax=Kitasatospora setae (strain ATCC 33774 / DSM 43861 / JCM 3304 / KCC A-0304 / NBRC 14216 / KM-6054) TaxID=452652 RepID=E4N810_KITSK|nr:MULTISPECIES: hypothetical protein [Kitasatospora]BAJ27341.1 hypothetical protein KSE_15140 [Kitasatospora setae KM-6054]
MRRTRAIAARLTAALVLAPVLGAAVAGCGADGDGAARGADDGRRAALGDVEVTACRVDDELRWPSATVRITNHTATTSNYVVQIAFEDGNGRQVTVGVAAASAVPPGQDALERAQGTADPYGPVSCRVADVARYASP